MNAAPDQPRRLIVLGSTGSIGVNTLGVVEHLQRNSALPIEVVGLAARSSTKALVEQARRFNVKRLAVADPASAAQLPKQLPDAQVFAGPDAAERLVRETDCTDVAAAIVGIAGLPATLAAAELGRRIHLSNKETLVAAGAMVMRTAKASGAEILPVDSEHSAIFQCIQGSVARERRAGECSSPPPLNSPTILRRLVLTASGGAFRDRPIEQIKGATPEDALKHPTWDMGPKVTVDSATMMNKGLEVIEAHWLFGVGADKIQPLIHPQSLVHSFVEFVDGSVLAQLGPPDMRTPIQVALTWPNRTAGCGDKLDWTKLGELNFYPPDPARYPAIELCYRALRLGGTAPAVLNAANEAAVQAFLDRKIAFGRIVELVGGALESVKPQPADDLATILEADRAARTCVAEDLQNAGRARLLPSRKPSPTTGSAGASPSPKNANG
jgi:1-deoxy-D-xylulose-5-phosphate reductoisomerase